MDALSHHSGMDDDDESNADALRQVAAGVPAAATAAAAAGTPAAEDGEAVAAAVDSDDSDVEADLRRLFRM